MEAVQVKHPALKYYQLGSGGDPTLWCSGCGIGDALDTEKLCELATKKYQVELCKTHPSLCGEEGAQVIRQDIEDGVTPLL